jgi:hypothetical protein
MMDPNTLPGFGTFLIVFLCSFGISIVVDILRHDH